MCRSLLRAVLALVSFHIVCAVNPLCILCAGCLSNPAAPACATVCVGVLGGCFADNETVSDVSSGSVVRRKVQDVAVGSKVLTMDAGNIIEVEVLKNERSYGLFPMLKFIVSEDESEDVAPKTLSVTLRHRMLVERGETLQAVEAHEVKVGDIMHTVSEVTGLQKKVRVVQITHDVHFHKNDLVTTHGTVLANGLHAGAFCADAVDVK